MNLLKLLIPIQFSLTLSSAVSPTKLIYEFPKDSHTWVENLAVRPCGSILITTFTTPSGSPSLYLIDPLSRKPQLSLIHQFSSALSLAGITETTPDTYYVAVANFTFANLTGPSGPNFIFRVFFSPNNDTAAISQIAALPDARALNGLTTLNSNTILAADSVKGVVWAINTITGTSRIVLSEPLLSSNNLPPGFGVNGIKIRNNTIYFTNTAQGFFAKIPINPDGTAAGEAVVIAPSPHGTQYDDFVLDGEGNAFLAVRTANELSEIKRFGGPQVIIAGMANSTLIAAPTAVEFGRTVRDRRVLYGTTGGTFGIPVTGDEVVGGQLVAVDVGRRREVGGIEWVENFDVGPSV